MPQISTTPTEITSEAELREVLGGLPATRTATKDRPRLHPLQIEWLRNSPFCVIATAGTTNTGAVDPLPELADLCAAESLWLHVDGAYGAPAALTARGRALLAGVEHADSLSLDPHKWLFQPYEAG